jgi:hypothetical protein
MKTEEKEKLESDQTEEISLQERWSTDTDEETIKPIQSDSQE